MSLKYTLLSLLCLLLIDSIISHDYEVVKKYGKETTYNKYIFIDTSEFDTGDKIYISITNHNGYDNSRIFLIIIYHIFFHGCGTFVTFICV